MSLPLAVHTVSVAAVTFYLKVRKFVNGLLPPFSERTGATVRIAGSGVATS